MEAIQDRIEAIILALDVTDREFAITSDISPSTLSNVLGGRRSNPSVEVLQKIKLAYPELNLNWLISGHGNMWQGSQEEIKQSESINLSKKVKNSKELINSNLEHNIQTEIEKGRKNKSTTNHLTHQIATVSINYHTGSIQIEYQTD